MLYFENVSGGQVKPTKQTIKQSINKQNISYGINSKLEINIIVFGIYDNPKFSLWENSMGLKCSSFTN